jgi:putative flippase GtrA
MISEHRRDVEVTSREQELQRIARFLLVGGINTVFGYAIYAGLVLLTGKITLSLLISSIAGIIFNFYTTGKIVFKSSDKSLFWLFLAVYGVIFLCNLVSLKYLLFLGFGPLLAQIILLPIIAAITYVLQKKFVFR